MPHFTLSHPGDLASPGVLARLGARWRALEAVSNGSFFQSWTWLGCQAASHFDDPVLLAGELNGETVALALCNRRRGMAGDTLWLGESGDAVRDAVYIEHNGPLLRSGMEAALSACLQAALLEPIDRRMDTFGRRLTMSGVGDVVETAARALPGRLIACQSTQPAPYVDLAALRAGGGTYLAALSANTRYQLRRSTRRYAQAGPLKLTRARDLAEALEFLDGLVVLHQASWTRRGRPGAFAGPGFLAFHQALIGVALPRGEVELLRINAGTEVIGYLYNFRWRGHVLAYQSGFAYPENDEHRKPGMTCHQLAIESALADGLLRYDFLAGGDRYKTSLATNSMQMHWLQAGPSWRPAALRTVLGGILRRR